MKKILSSKKIVENNTYRIDWEDIVKIIGEEAFKDSQFSIKVGDRTFSEKVFPIHVYISKTEHKS